MCYDAEWPIPTSSMGRKRQVDRQYAAVTAALAKRFSEFRRSHPPNTPFPQELRSATLAALAQGARPATVRRLCRISKTQLARWGWTDAKGVSSSKVLPIGPPAEPTFPAPRVFSVVDDNETTEEASAPGSKGRQELEIRLGPWCICLRLSESSGHPPAGDAGEVRTRCSP
jgi:hypothetical protein